MFLSILNPLPYLRCLAYDYTHDRFGSVITYIKLAYNLSDTSSVPAAFLAIGSPVLLFSLQYQSLFKRREALNQKKTFFASVFSFARQGQYSLKVQIRQRQVSLSAWWQHTAVGEM